MPDQRTFRLLKAGLVCAILVNVLVIVSLATWGEPVIAAGNVTAIVICGMALVLVHLRQAASRSAPAPTISGELLEAAGADLDDER